MSSIGEQIREIADEIDKLAPDMAPFFMGIERPTPGTARCMFQCKVIIGEHAGLAYAVEVLKNVKGGLA